ncbi:MAG: ATP-binding cassette domain-containing protein [Draconibacterium sp.]|nr:ATP-binding cassette domain-containing protein [Draconibacterium sp.]
MSEFKHCAIFAPGLSMQSTFIQNLLKGIVPEELKAIEGKRGVLFSTFTLEKFIKEEVLHDDYTLSEAQHRSIRTFSSGEQKKALLNYLIKTNPDFLLLDNVFDMLDIESQQLLQGKLFELSKNLSILQVVKRKDNLLPFIKNAVYIVNNKINFSGSVEEYLNQFRTDYFFAFEGALPPPISKEFLVENPLVQFKNVSVEYGDKPVVKNISWTISKSDFWQLKGPNGSGKTTLLTMITGDNPKAYGQDIVLFGRQRGSGESIWEIKKKIGYVTPSMTSIFRGWNTVEKMVISGLVDSIGLYKKPTELQRQLADEWIELIGLGEQKHTRFSTLSEVQQCMVLIARSMIKHPPLLILDEPSHGLDDFNASVLTALVNKIADEGNTTIIYVSHRNEPGLQPKQVYELFPGESGSIGREI